MKSKSTVLQAVISHLKVDLARQRAANRQAKEGATDSESRAESKWDTGGLEASYLARGYARQFEETVKQLETLRTFDPESAPGDRVGLGSMVLLEMGEFSDWMFLLPCCGGMELEVEGTTLTIFTPESPLAGQLLKNLAGSQFLAPGGLQGKILKIV